jgi:dihydrofolate reductase
MPRKIIVNIATSADGYIARPDGDFAWLNQAAVGNYGMGKFYKKVDTVIMGRKTYEAGVKMGQKGYPGLQNYVFSASPKKSDVPHVEYLKEDIEGFAKRLRSAKGKHIWLVGGSSIIAAFLDKQQIDEFIIHVIPIFIGAGIPLIQAKHRNIDLRLLKARRYSDGVVRLHYRVKR